MFNVDFVFPYVNPNDPFWQTQFSYFKGTEFNLKEERFRDFSVVKYIFRSIEQYAPWINRIVLIVAYKSQLPSWLKECDNLYVVEHKDFIPKEYLPTFNSNTIEMFIHKIPGLAEHFIYSNDDLLFINNTSLDDFFENENKIKLAYTFQHKKNPTAFLGSCKRTWDVVEQLFSRHYNLSEDYVFLKQFHGAASPRLLSDCKECYKLLEDKILKSLSLFRNVDKNLNQYMFGYFSLYREHVSSIMMNNKIGVYLAAEDGIDKIEDAVFNCPARMLCINDTKCMTVEILDKVYNFLEKKFPKKSKYEI